MPAADGGSAAEGAEDRAQVDLLDDGDEERGPSVGAVRGPGGPRVSGRHVHFAETEEERAPGPAAEPTDQTETLRHIYTADADGE